MLPFMMPIMPFMLATTNPPSISGSQSFPKSQQIDRRPRIQSAANAQQFGGMQKTKFKAPTGSEGVQSTYANSQGELNMIDYNMQIMGSGGLSGLSEFPRDARMMGTMATKYAAPAIQEESMQENTRFLEQP